MTESSTQEYTIHTIHYTGMCEPCTSLTQLLLNCEARLSANVSQYPPVRISELDVILTYITTWPQRQCMCCYRDSKNFDRFNLLVQSVLYLAVCQLRILRNELRAAGRRNRGEARRAGEENAEERPERGDSDEGNDGDRYASDADDSDGGIPFVSSDEWTVPQREKLMNVVWKIFQLNFPLYVACKHSTVSRLDDLTAQEIAALDCYCDLHDTEVPVYLLRNVNLFCKTGGISAMAAVFRYASPETFPVSAARSVVSAVSDLKLWLNYRAVTRFFVPLRLRVLKYMCKLEDKDLRLTDVKTMADFMWGAGKDPLDAPIVFDCDGLDLAFKYFNSTTLTMRLAGITQINAQISVFNEMCVGEAVPEAETVGRQLAQWLCDNQIMEHLFGPNLHVEVIKQAHIVLKFLAMENRITEEHIELLWQASQLKHCSKQVHDLFSVFIKSLAARPCSHLYKLLCSLPLKEHTEQSLSLASSLMRVMWSRSSQAAAAAALAIGAGPSGSRSASVTGEVHTRLHTTANAAGMSCSIMHHHDSSSEASVSMDPTNSDEDPCEELSTSGDEIGPTPRKQPKSQTVTPAADKHKWVNRQRDEAKKEDGSPKSSNKRGNKDDGVTSGSLSSGVEEMGRRPPKKKILRKRKNTKRGLFGDVSKIEIGELIESISDVDETSGSETELCAIPKSTALQRLNAARDPSLHMIKHSDRSLEEPCPQVSIHDCSTLCESMEARQLMELMSGDDGEASLSSAMSNKSDKNMADFDGEESGCEEELARLAAQAECMGGYRVSSGMMDYSRMNFRGAEPHEPLCPRRHHPDISDCHTIMHKRHGDHKDLHNLHFNLKLDDVCKPGNTLLWDLLQDENIKQLGDDLALEAEKALYNLLGYNIDKFIRLKFIEGCLNNLENHRSVAVSLRLLPKLFSSFQQLRGMDMHQVVLWAEREHKMMQLFFNDLKYYMSNYVKNASWKNIMDMASVHNQQVQQASGGYMPPLFSHMSEVTVRLQFLTTIFSPMGSPANFRLTLEQVDILWNCLVNDAECADCLFSWLLSHAKSTDQHALGIDTLKYLYIEKMPTLNPETLSLMGLSLYQQLISLARMALGQVNLDTRDPNYPHVLAMDHLWKIALKANNTDVSTTAIQYLNSYYMGQHLQQEEEFVSQCMSHLDAAAAGLITKSDDCRIPNTKNNTEDYSTEEASLQCIQRALLLLKTHLDTFKRRYAYHLRMWTLTGNTVCGSSMEGTPLKVIVQPGSVNMKTTFQMFNTDYVADLRAQITFWWEQIQSEEGSGSFADGPIRMITQGQELVVDYDERSLYDMGFKDNQLVLISVGMSGARTGRGGGSSAWGDWPSQQPPPPRDLLPTLLLLKPQYFDRLFALMQTLGEMTTPGSDGERVAHMKAQLLSRRVWDILHAVPLCPALLGAFRNPVESRLPDLLNPSSPQRLMYSLHIVDKLSSSHESVPHALPKCANVSVLCSREDEEEKETWAQLFIRNGGLRHLFDIFMSGILQSEDGEENEWRQDCLVLLLKLIGHLGTVSSNKGQAQTKNQEAPHIPLLHESLLSLMEVESATKRLMSILTEAARHRDPSLYKTGFSGRSNVVQHCMWLLVCWVHSWSGAATSVVCSPSISVWLPRLLLEDPQPQVRRETCSALYRLCLGGGNAASPGKTSARVIPAILRHLLEHLPRAESMRTSKTEPIHHPAAEEGKEPYGPACRDYFWLVCRLVDGLPSELVKENGTDDASGLDLNGLCSHLTDSVCAREIIEKRNEPSVPDDGLYGQINLLTHLVKHPLAFKVSEKGKKLIDSVFGFLFDVANPMERYLPKCKSQKSRAAAYDLLIELVKGAPDNYVVLHHKLMDHHRPGLNSTYPWDYWPAEEGRSECGYVGLTNLGATCYMASCMQHLYMMPQARTAILRADPTKSKHQYTLVEMQRMFAYLLESERKSYNPRSFCKVYQMDHQPLNTGEQKDMAEFFINLVSKLEEMTPELKKLVKTMFGGVISNNVVSLDCSHVSRTLEEFYTVRCQVADMRNLYQSLNEVTVKDTLEGDNCYTCSQCSTKVRAEKRACFKKLPHILCFNTMRYTFNMVTMLKEKVNTHFSFPMHLDMSGYVEKHLMPTHYREEKEKIEMKKDGKGEEDEETECDDDFNENYEYDLIGVTVHTGTADGGHYYSFIKERNFLTPLGSNTSINGSAEKWFLFNDAEVKQFDPSQIPAECFGGEMTSKTYDSVTDKFMDFSFEKTNSAYMLFYERDCRGSSKESTSLSVQTSSTETVEQVSNQKSDPPIVLSPVLQKWIWDDNMIFLHHKNIFQHAYFTFMAQMCSYVPQSLLTFKPEITQVAAQLSTSFFIETFIHAKEKPTMVSWIELVTKQFNASAAASEWFLEHMAEDTWWPMQVLIKCPNQMVRQMFQRLCIHVIQRLRSTHCSLYLQGCDDVDDIDGDMGEASCVTRFIKMLLSLMENGAKAHLRHLTEYFSLLYEFSKMGEEESQFLLKANAISAMVSFYLGHTSTSTADGSSSDEGGGDKLKPTALDKMVALVAGLVEKSRDSQRSLNLTSRDQHALQGGKGFPFLYQQTRDCLNLQQTKTLIHAMCRWNERLAQHIISMIFQAITKHTESCQPFFKLLTLLIEGGGGAGSGSGLPCFTQLALKHVWDATESCPHAAIEWLSLQVPRNKMVHTCVLQSADTWIESYLMGHANQRVRSAASFLLISLVPSAHFRQSYRANMRCLSVHKDVILSEDAMLVLHQVYTLLLEKLKAAKKYIDVATHGHMKLTAYFGVLSYCLVSRVEKIMFGQYFRDLWDLFHPGLSEPAVSVYPNKQAVLSFWYAVCIDCPENVHLIVSNPTVSKHIAFNYILADHEDSEVIGFNRVMLPSYYAILRLCCQNSQAFTRALSQHQNIHWAFKNITPHPGLYSAAIEELFKLMQLFAARSGDASEQELREIHSFRRNILTTYLQGLNGRNCWTTLISAFRTLVDTDDDRLYIVYNGGLQMAFDALHNLHNAYHEVGGGTPVLGDLRDLLSLTIGLCKSLRSCRDCKEARAALNACKDWPEVPRRLITLLNTYNPKEIRNLAIGLLKEMLLLLGSPTLSVLVPLLAHCHCSFQDNRSALPLGPYFPVRGMSAGMGEPKINQSARPLRPLLQMCIPHSQLQAKKGVDPEYDKALSEFYLPYHSLLDAMCRLAVERGCCSSQLLTLACMAACEAVPLRFTLFPTLWHEVYSSEDDEHKYSSMLLECSFLSDYMNLVLLDERETLNLDSVYQFFSVYFPKVEGLKSVSCVGGIIVELETNVNTVSISEGELLGDLRAMHLLLPRTKIVERDDMIQRLKETLAKLNIRISEYKPPDTENSENAKSKEESESRSESAPQEQIDVMEASTSTSTSQPCQEESPSPSSSPSSRCLYVNSVKCIIEDITNIITPHST